MKSKQGNWKENQSTGRDCEGAGCGTYMDLHVATHFTRAGTIYFCCERFEGIFSDDYPTLGLYTDEFGARFTVEFMKDTLFNQIKALGDRSFKSKIRLQVFIRRA
jgi:hypothetical protein